MEEQSKEPSSSAEDPRKPKLHVRRRAHRKSRAGCQTCKKRKIKCDEQKPDCGNCIKHSLNCEYAQTQSTFDVQASSSVFVPGSLNVFDLELLHHFCTSTAFSVQDHPTIRTLWSTNVPKIGLKHDFVMHGILACSALHLAQLYPERQEACLAQASLHYHAGLQKGTPALATFSDENATAMYLFSSLTVMYTIAHARFHDPAVLSSEGGLASWIVLNRQSYGIVRIAQDVLFKGPLGPMFRIGEQRNCLQDQVTLDGFHGADSLRELSSRIDRHVEEPRVKEAYHHAITLLVKTYAVVYGLPPNAIELSDVLVWPYRVSEDFLELLHQSRQEALVVLAFFAVLAKQLTIWCAEGFADTLMAMIYCLIDEDHMPWIQWPMEEMNFRPEQVRRPPPVSQYPDPMAT